MPTHSSKPKRRRDVNQLAKSIVGIATGQDPEPKPEREKNPAAVALGKLGGAKGGRASRSPHARAAVRDREEGSG